MEYSSLLMKFAAAAATKEEKQAFNTWLDSLSPAEYRKVLDEYEMILLNANVADEFQQEWLDELLINIRDVKESREKVLHISARSTRRWIAAASVILMIAFGGFFVLLNKKSSEQSPVVSRSAPADIVAPQSSRAVITLGSGKQIFLDSAGNGTLATENNVRIVKREDGKIEYNFSGATATSQALIYNTLTNPRGSRVIDIVLADGSRVWLNAGSSLRYPEVFGDGERRVSLDGEGYFEVTSTASKPFVVTKNDMQVKVLGTHFNVNAYNDEKDIKVTLLKGSVAVSDENSMSLIKPGEQAQIVRNKKMIVTGDIDVDEVMAWKNGQFIFTEKTDIHTIMRQIARWYNVDVEYRGTVNSHFWGSISNDVNVSKVLKMLETTGGVTITIENSKVVVMPGKQ